MATLTKTQYCPYCKHEVDDSHAEWEEGQHDVICDYCNKEYSVTTEYKFLGWEIEKFCTECQTVESECCCDDGEESEEDGQIDLLDII